MFSSNDFVSQPVYTEIVHHEADVENNNNEELKKIEELQYDWDSIDIMMLFKWIYEYSRVENPIMLDFSADYRSHMRMMTLK